MKERPIIMSSGSVRAILEGRKTQTRRIVKPLPIEHYYFIHPEEEPGMRVTWKDFEIYDPWEELPPFCPYGKVGDRLWVRETWVSLLHTSPMTGEPLEPKNGDKLITHASYREVNGKKIWRYDGEVIAYKATSTVTFCDGDGFSGDLANKEEMAQWRSPIFMPKKFSRIMLEITNIRVERLGEITEQDAIAEGISTDLAIKCNNWKPSMSDPDSGGKPNYLAGFWHTWDSIHKDPHNRFLDPWVWVIEFKVVNEG